MKKFTQINSIQKTKLKIKRKKINEQNARDEKNDELKEQRED